MNCRIFHDLCERPNHLLKATSKHEFCFSLLSFVHQFPGLKRVCVLPNAIAVKSYRQFFSALGPKTDEQMKLAKFKIRFRGREKPAL